MILICLPLFLLPPPLPPPPLSLCFCVSLYESIPCVIWIILILKLLFICDSNLLGRHIFQFRRLTAVGQTLSVPEAPPPPPFSKSPISAAGYTQGSLPFLIWSCLPSARNHRKTFVSSSRFLSRQSCVRHEMGTLLQPHWLQSIRVWGSRVAASLYQRRGQHPCTAAEGSILVLQQRAASLYCSRGQHPCTAAEGLLLYSDAWVSSQLPSCLPSLLIQETAGSLWRSYVFNICASRMCGSEMVIWVVHGRYS